MNEWRRILPQHKITYLGGPESASIETSLHKFLKTIFYEINLVSQSLHLEVLLLELVCCKKRQRIFPDPLLV